MTMLSTYVTLGRTGLRMSSLALGTMTFDRWRRRHDGGLGRAGPTRTDVTDTFRTLDDHRMTA